MIIRNKGKMHGTTSLSNTSFFDTELAMERTSSRGENIMSTELRIIRFIKSSGCLWMYVYKKQSSVPQCIHAV